MVAWKLVEPPDPTPIPRRRPRPVPTSYSDEVLKVQQDAWRDFEADLRAGRLCPGCLCPLAPTEQGYTGQRYCVDCAEGSK